MTYQRKMFLLLMVAVGGALLIGVIGAFLPNLGVRELPMAVRYPLYLGLGFVVFAITWPWWKRLDDVQRTGHMASWYWGGMGGAVACAMWLAAAGIQFSDFGRGAATMIVAQFVGFLLFFAFWHFRGRGVAE